MTPEEAQAIRDAAIARVQATQAAAQAATLAERIAETRATILADQAARDTSDKGSK